MNIPSNEQIKSRHLMCVFSQTNVSYGSEQSAYPSNLAATLTLSEGPEKPIVADGEVTVSPPLLPENM
jgi:hypothetical protein